jgi:alkenylglycerophosphocholine/alkenylglycerophosphoethanolamine hydrolase
MNKSTRNRIAVAIYLVLAVVFFAIRGWFVAVPTLFTAVATATNSKAGGVMIPLALLASAAGDYAGSTGNFIMQVAFFAVAHIFYICDFGPRRAAMRSNLGYATALAVITIGYLGFVLAHIESQIEFIAVAIYGLIIFTMGATSIFQQRPHKWWYVAAALLFIVSDSLIVFGKYIAPIPNRSLWVMTTYYAAQGLFMTLHLNRKSLAD